MNHPHEFFYPERLTAYFWSKLELGIDYEPKGDKLAVVRFDTGFFGLPGQHLNH